MKTNIIIIKPVLTEKATGMSQKGVYTFEVDQSANKNSVKELLTKLYKVKISQVKMLVRKGKLKKVGRRMQTKKSTDRKYAYVTVTEGTISLFPKQ